MVEWQKGFVSLKSLPTYVICKQFEPRSGSTKRQAWSKLFDTQLVLLK